MKDAKGHGSEAQGGAGAAHQEGVTKATATERPADPAKVQSFVTGAQGIINAYYQKNFGDSPHMVPPTLSIPNQNSGRYLRVVKTDNDAQGKPLSAPGTGSVHAFIDKTTGHVLKAAGWKGPAKGPRGNIHDEYNGLGRMGPHGPAYNK